VDETAHLRTDDAAWDAFVASAFVPSFLQATPWAAVKRPNGWQSGRVAVPTPRGQVGAQILVRPLGPLPFGFGYAARGPIAQFTLDIDALHAFTEALRADASRLGASYVRIDPELEDPDGSIAAGLRSLGWRPAPEVQPARTRLLDLSLDEEAIWEGIHRKWRQSIRKGERDGMRVVPAGIERIGQFHRIHVATIQRVGLPMRSEASFRTLYEAFAAAGRAHLSFSEGPDGVATGTILLLGWGNRVVDLYGGTTAAGRQLRANYAIKWAAIKAAKAAGYLTYDLWGLPSDSVSDFKSGWGGREVDYVGAWDLVVDPLGRFAFEAALRGRATWLRLRRGRGAGVDSMSAT
jgi:lipid II:glycine glycyltransferase (peptidoglycan interpeptide bridge formation enzyme)